MSTTTASEAKDFVVQSLSTTHTLEYGLEGTTIPTRLGGTDADENDMRMLGRVQQLNASRPLTLAPPTYRCVLTEWRVEEKLPVHLDSGLCMHAHVYLGNRPDDKPVFAPQRGNRGLDLGLSDCMGGLHDGVCHHCRDGLPVRIEHAKSCSLTREPLLMLSRAPTSGGQYHWVSEFAPVGTQKFVSYLVGKSECPKAFVVAASDGR